MCVSLCYRHSDADCWVTAVAFPLLNLQITSPYLRKVKLKKVEFLVSWLIELVPIKRCCISHQKVLTPVLVFLVPLFLWNVSFLSSLSRPCVTLPFPISLVLSSVTCYPCFALLRCRPLGCKPAVSRCWFAPGDRLPEGLVWGSCPESLLNVTRRVVCL